MAFSIGNSQNEAQMRPDELGENTLIDDIDTNGHILHEEEETGQAPFFNDPTRHSVIGKIFDNPDVAYNFYNEYGLVKGFGIRKFQAYKRKSTNEIHRRVFVCNKQGFKNMNDKRQSTDVQRRSITRTGCKAMIQVTLSKQGEWVVDKFSNEHNHPLDPPSQVLKQRSHNIFHRSNECKSAVTVLSKAGLKPSEITKVVNAIRQDEDDKLTRVQCSNIVGSERKKNIGKECRGIIMHFQEKVEHEEDFYFAINLSADGTLANVFWADGRSRSSYCQFGDVVVFDVTYKTNRYSLPFAPFVGVNHHGQSILFGGALVEDETESTFTWLFEQFLKCMHQSSPISIITDQDRAIGKAIAKVFPNTRHRFCAWHIKKHVLEHLQPLRSRFHDFEDTYTQWVKSENAEDFEKKWEEMKETYSVEDDSWLGKMYALRKYWIKAYLKDTFFAGMTTSGRSESINSFFDGYVNSKTMLNEFVIQYDKAVSSRRGVEEDEDHRTSNSKPTLHSDHPIEAMAAECYTRNMYEVFKKEWKASFDCGHETLSKNSDLVKYRVGCLKGNKEAWKIVEYKVCSDFFAKCSCGKFETYGMLCKHILYIMKKKSTTIIPNHYILPRWTMKARNKMSEIGNRLGGTIGDATSEVNLFILWTVRAKFNKVLQNGQDCIAEIQQLDTFLDSVLEYQNGRKKARVEEISDNGSTIQIGTQENISQNFMVSDPKAPVKTKGRPKVATRIKSSIEINMEPKKRKCGYCGGKGHYSTGCQKKKGRVMSYASIHCEILKCQVFNYIRFCFRRWTRHKSYDTVELAGDLDDA